MSRDFPSNGPVEIRTNLADSMFVKALKAGEVETGDARLRFEGPTSAHDGFKPMVREGKFAAGELAIATFLQAVAYGKPLVLLPATVVGRLQHHCIAYNAERGALRPKDLEGRRVAVRSYSQTTGVWVRGILQHQFGVDLGKVTWLCNEGAHVAEHRDPPNVERVPEGGKSAAQMVLDGDVDAAILGKDMPKAGHIRSVIPDPAAAARVWYGEHQAAMINHMIVVDAALSKQRPDVVRSLYGAVLESKQRAGKSEEPDMLPFGYDAVRPGLELVIAYAHEQKLIPRRVSVDDLFDETTRRLGA